MHFKILFKPKNGTFIFTISSCHITPTPFSLIGWCTYAFYTSAL